MKRGVLVAIGVGVAAALAGGGLWYSQATSAENPSNIVVSDFETRNFQTYRLDNGLKVLLASDPDSDKAAAAMNVSVGSWSNPDDLPGLAHFLEHMLFLGTEQYPEVDGYHRFIEQHGGSNNAYTGAENTLYHFDINPGRFEEALDRFSQFFIAPLFDADYIEREINAVHSEFTASLQNDSRRLQDVLSTLYRDDHPASSLAIGNRQTLEHPDLRERLIRFYREHYLADRMALTVYGPQDMATLRAWVEERFGGLRAVDSEDPVFDQPFFDDSDLPQLVEVQPRRESRTLQLRFPVPGNLAVRDTQPDDFIAHLLGQETAGSPLAVLKDRGWAESLNVRPGQTSASGQHFVVGISLTPDGLDNWQEAAALIFAYLERIESEGLEEWRYQELADIRDVNFQFAEDVSPAATVQRLAERLSLYDPDQVLAGPYRMAEFQPDTLRQWLGYLQPDNALVVLMHPGAPGESTSPWYETPFARTPLAGNTLAEWRAPTEVEALRLPEPNPFVPDDLEVLPMEAPTSSLYENHPQVIRQSPGYRLWHEQDDRFRTPKLDLSVLVETAVTTSDARNRVMTRLYLDLVDDALAELRNAAGQAGSGYGLSATERGIELRLYGYSEPLPSLFDTLLVELAEHEIDPERFERVKADLARRLRNSSEDPVLGQMVRRLNQFLARGAASPEALGEALADITPDDLRAQRERWLEQLRLTMLVHGNVTAGEAAELGERARSMLPPSADAPAVQPEAALLPGRSFRHAMRISHNDSALLAYHQGANSSLRERALYALTGRMLSAPYFSELRTREQLGYVVFARSHEVRDLPGLMLYVQSPSTDPALLQLYSDRFMTRHTQTLRDLDESEFQRFKAGLTNRLTAEAQNLHELSQRYWQAIGEGNPNFNTAERLAGEVGAISQDGFIRFFETRLLAGSARRLVLHQVGAGRDDDYDEHGQGLVGFHPADEPEDVQNEATWVTPTFNNLPER